MVMKKTVAKKTVAKKTTGRSADASAGAAAVKRKNAMKATDAASRRFVTETYLPKGAHQRSNQQSETRTTDKKTGITRITSNYPVKPKTRRSSWVLKASDAKTAAKYKDKALRDYFGK